MILDYSKIITKDNSPKKVIYDLDEIVEEVFNPYLLQSKLIEEITSDKVSEEVVDGMYDTILELNTEYFYHKPLIKSMINPTKERSKELGTIYKLNSILKSIPQELVDDTYVELVSAMYPKMTILLSNNGLNGIDLWNILLNSNSGNIENDVIYLTNVLNNRNMMPKNISLIYCTLYPMELVFNTIVFSPIQINNDLNKGLMSALDIQAPMMIKDILLQYSNYVRSGYVPSMNIFTYMGTTTIEVLNALKYQGCMF